MNIKEILSLLSCSIIGCLLEFMLEYLLRHPHNPGMVSPTHDVILLGVVIVSLAVFLLRLVRGGSFDLNRHRFHIFQRKELKVDITVDELTLLFSSLVMTAEEGHVMPMIDNNVVTAKEDEKRSKVDHVCLVSLTEEGLIRDILFSCTTDIPGNPFKVMGKPTLITGSWNLNSYNWSNLSAKTGLTIVFNLKKLGRHGPSKIRFSLRKSQQNVLTFANVSTVRVIPDELYVDLSNGTVTFSNL